MKKECKHCKKEFETSRSNKVFCCYSCNYEYDKWHRPNRKRWIRTKEQILSDNINKVSEKEIKERQHKFFKDKFNV